MTGQWTTTDELPTPASWYGQHDGAILLRNNKVLIAGGADGSSAAVNKAALYDPVAQTWTATAASMRALRRLHTATRLDDGKVLVAGGTSGSSPLSPGLASAEIYNPANDSWSPATDMHEARLGHSAVLLADKKVLVAGGIAVRSGDSVRALRSAEIYDPADNTWTVVGPMTDARSGHPAVLLQGGKVLVCGGTVPISGPVSGAGETALAFCELYSPDTRTWAPTGSLAEPRSRHQAVLASGTTVLAIGGSTPGTPGDGRFDPFDELGIELYDLATGAWSTQPATPGGRGFHRAVSLGDGKVLVIGGTADARNDAGYQSTLIFDAAEKSWSVAAGLETGRWAFAATALADGDVLVTGGAIRSGLAAADPATVDLTRSTEVFSL